MPDGTRQVCDALAAEGRPPGRPHRRLGGHAARVWLVAIVGPAVVWSAVFAALAAAASDELGPEECHGIGWGCTLTDRESVALFALAFGVVVVPLATVASVVAAAMARAEPGERGRAGATALLISLSVIGLGVMVLRAGI